MSQQSKPFISYGKQTIENCDIQAVVDVLTENKYLTTGPKIAEFEQNMCQYVGCKYAVAMNSCTGALHACVRALGIGPEDEVIVNAISFIASSNAVLYEGGTPVFCDIRKDTMNLDLDKLETLITDQTKAIIFVDFAGQANDYHRLRKIAQQFGLSLIEDAAHSVGLQINQNICPYQPKIGSFADLTAFSFHPVKNMTTAEGGMVLTNNEEMANICRRFRAHGINDDHKQRHLHYYDMVDLGFNYRITDLQCALGISQLRRLPQWLQKRQEIAQIYDQAFQKYGKKEDKEGKEDKEDKEDKEGKEDKEDKEGKENKESGLDLFRPLVNRYGSAYHIYIIVLNLEALTVDRDTIFAELREQGIGVNVHYKPIYLNTYYQKHPLIKSDKGLCPVAEKMWERIITLPLHPSLSDEDIERVIHEVGSVVEKYSK